MPQHLTRTCCRHLIAFAALSPASLFATPALTELSLEELLNVEVTSVSKKPQSLSDAAAAVFVISNDDIRRSGVTSIPEALRMVPGMTVKRIDANKWSLSARGFTNRLANKLLVLIDGRTIYSPTYSGVYWEQNEVPLADVERIEVIRGPGATLWGANAVNGVINIITKSAADTPGGLLTLGGGSEERLLAGVRYGGKLGTDTFVRTYLKYHDHAASVTSEGDTEHDAWDSGQGGFRLDRTLAAGDRVTLQGDVYTAALQQQLLFPDPTRPPAFQHIFTDRFRASGWNLLGRWERALSVSADVSLKLFVDHAERNDAYLGQVTDVFDVEWQHHRKFGLRHDVVWGLGYRHIADDFDRSVVVQIIPASDQRDVWNAFVQDEIELVPDRLRLTLGSKFEHSPYTGWAAQPTARLLGKLTPQHTVWGAVSRAVRTPSRIENGGTAQLVTVRTVTLPGMAPLPVPVVMQAVGNQDFDAEALTAYELGWRATPTPRFNVDLALFYHQYDHLRSGGDDGGTIRWDTLPSGYALVDLVAANRADGHSYGAELAAELQVRDNWRLALAYSDLELTLDTPTGSQDGENAIVSRVDPRQQISLRSLFNPRSDIDLDGTLRYVDQSYGAGNTWYVFTPAYWECDLRLAWRPRAGLELSLVGQNLLHAAHFEGTQDVYGVTQTSVERGVYGAVQVQF